MNQWVISAVIELYHYTFIISDWWKTESTEAPESEDVTEDDDLK